MKLKVVFALLCNFYKANSETATTQLPAKYPPCDNNIIFAYDNTLKLEETTYKKQINFLTNYAFEQWTNFGKLTLYSDGHEVFKTDFKNKSDVKDYILKNKQVNHETAVCDIFTDLYYTKIYEFKSFIIFLREFNKNEVDSMCDDVIDDLNSGNNLILFVPLSSAVSVDDLKDDFPNATILVWDIVNKDAPDNWKEQFNENFGCDGYPCSNWIFIGYETTTELAASRYKKQIDFLANMLFDNWTRFDRLAVLSYGDDIFKTDFKSKFELTNFIAKDTQIKTDITTCDTFADVASHIRNKLFNIVLFLREFNQKDVDAYCKAHIHRLNTGPIAFVILSEDVIVEELEIFFPRAKFIKWDIENTDAPDDWRNQFYDAYGCNPQETTTTYPIITTENPIDCCQCSKKVFVAYDKSTVLNGTEFKRLQNFLIDYVFKGWLSVDQLKLVSFAGNKTKDEFKYPENKKLLDSFIRNDKQVDKKPSLCEMFDHLDLDYVNIIFTSEFTVEDITEDCRSLLKYPDNGIDFITFVAMTENVQIDFLNEYYPQAQIIKWNVSEEETPRSWEWHFMEAYNCKKHDQQMHPCDRKILIGYDESLTTNLLNTLKEFLTNSLFNRETWNVFEDLELIAYSKDMRIQDFGTMNSLNDVHNFINNGTETNSTTSLCQVFYELASAHTLGINIILFVSEFHEHESDECPFWIEKVRNNANSITFVNLTKQVNTDYLLSKIPHANFISWPIENKKSPDDWNIQFFSAFGCENFSVESQTYPCLNGIGIFFDRSRYLSPFAYQRLTNFLLTKLFINEWTNFEYTSLVSYADRTDRINPARSLLQTKFFIHQSLKTEEESKLCETLKGFRIYSTYFIFFISKFDDEVLTRDCLSDVKDISKQITFIALTPLVNITLLQQTFPHSIFISWDIEQEPELTNWTQVLWESFGCANESSIVFPHSTSTSLSTTMPLTSTVKASTMSLVSTTQTSTTKLITSTVTTTTARIPSTKSSNSGGNSKEKILLGIFIPLLIIVILGFIACFCLYKRRKHRQLVENMVSSKFYRENEACDEDREEDQWEIQIEYLQINFLDKLGSGVFGDVYLGKINGPAPIKTIYSDSPHCQRFQNCEVAIKSLPQTQVDEYARSEFWKEIEFMKDLKSHVNLVCFLGYVYDLTSPLMLLEYCANGDLLKFIKTNKQKFVESFQSQEDNSDSKALLSFAWQISSGLECLSSLGLIHRDVAARNILLDAQNVCKVSDFGLCRLAEDLTYQSKGGKLPIRWMAIESLKDYVYSQKTDVWSYGVLLWELFTLGDLPYAHIENILTFIESGKRLDKPRYCSDQIYEIMMSCWELDPEERPTFTAICQILSKMLETSTMHYNYVDTLALIEEANQIEELDEINV